jgi:hypothetical protein
VRVLTAVAPLALVTALAAAAPAQAPAPNGVTWTLPPGWVAIDQQLTSVVEPRQQLAAASFPVRQTKRDPDCSPATARRQLPRDGVLVQLLESEGSAGPRPVHFRLRRSAIRPYECFGPGIIVNFRDHGRTFQAMVMAGAKARLAQAERLLDSLVVQAVPPPPPPARWPVISTQAGDGLKVPFGWRAASLAVPKRLPRPRLLFWTANQRLPQHPAGHRPWLGDPALPPRLDDDGVAVWVVEHRRGTLGGPPAYTQVRPPAGANYTVRTRDLVWHGYRFSVSVLAGPRARPQDVNRAFLSADSLGVSSVGRRFDGAAQRRLLWRQPYMGVSCRRPNVTTCDRVGLAVWLRRPARHIVARVNGRRLALDDPDWGNTQDPRGPLYVGFLRPAGLTDPGGPLGVPKHYEGVPPRAAWVELDVDGRTTGLVVPLSAGWG